MTNRRLFLFTLTSFATSIAITSCGTSQNSTSTAPTSEKIKVGVTPVPAGDILKFVKDNLAKQAGLDIEIITFNDFVQNNTALKDGVIDANYFQHIPFMENYAKKHNFEMHAFTPQIHLTPIGLFSKRYKSLKDIPDKALVTIPDDPSNAHRALKVLEEANLIKLKQNVTLFSPLDIIENQKNLQIKEIPGAQAIPSLPDVDLAGITGNWVIQAGLRTDRDALAIESGKDPIYAVTVVTLKGKENEPKIKKLHQLLRDDKVKQFIKDKYQGAVIPI
jgi:D-methionine transport system substrate-binding protein